MNQIPITPADYDEEQRVQAIAIATEQGTGVRMEIGNMMTRYYIDPSIPVGVMDIWAVPFYKASFPEFVTRLEHPTDEFGYRDLTAWTAKQKEGL